VLVTNDRETNIIDGVSHSRHSKLHAGHINQ
jgi:hypothetical protein